MKLHRYGVLKYKHMVHHARARMLSPFRRSKYDYEKIYLFVPESSLSQLNENLPHSGFNYVNGRMIIDGKLRKIKYRYRGDFSFHWAHPKKSIRIKTSKKNLYRKMRKFNLVAPKGIPHLYNYFSYILADQLEMFSPKAELAEVILNGKSIGVHLLLEQLDESTVRKHGVMPGDLFAGEFIQKDRIKGTSNNVFDHPGLWKKVAINNHYKEDAFDSLQKLMTALNQNDSLKKQQELEKILDMEEWAKFSVFESLSHSYHYDETHNWRLFFDPITSKFTPVVWDPLGWTQGPHTSYDKKMQIDVVRHKIHQALFRNHNYLRYRVQILQQFFAKGQAKKFLKKVEQIGEQFSKNLYNDPYLYPPEPKRVKRTLKALVKRIGFVFKTVEGAYFGEPTKVDYFVDSKSNSVNFRVKGRIPVKSIKIPLAKGNNSKQIDAELSYLQAGRWIKNSRKSLDLSFENNTLEIRNLLLPDYKIARLQRPSVPLYTDPDFSYFIINLQSGLKADGNVLFELSGPEEAARLLVKNEPYSVDGAGFRSDTFGIVQSKKPSTPLVWKGSVEIKGIKVIERPVVIQPGTKILLSENSSIIFKNKVTAVGAANNKIQFSEMVKDQKPWGTVALQGSGTAGSSFRHCQFSYGSGLKRSTFEYSAMFDIHDTYNVTVEDSFFHDSRIVDDMVHVAYSKVKFRNVNFLRSKSDALDLDVSQATLENCTFRESGNDAADLMTTRASIINSQFIGSGDKGISVGEGSHLFSAQNHFKKNEIGIQAKDGSKAFVINSNFVDNASDFDAYKKNWRYDGGGRIKVFNSILSDGKRAPSADKKSKISISTEVFSRSNFGQIGADHEK